VYDAAVDIRGGSASITEDDVKRAEKQLFRGLRPSEGDERGEEEPEPNIDPALGEAIMRRRLLAPDEEPEDDDLSEGIHQLLDRLGELASAVGNVRARVAVPGISAEAVFEELRRLLEEVDEVRQATFLAFGGIDGEAREDDED